MRYAVVLLMASECEEAPEGLPTRCVMDVIGCADREEALRVASGVPAWTTPHIMGVSAAADFLAGP